MPNPISATMDSLESYVEAMKKALNQPLASLTPDELGQVAFMAQQIDQCNTTLSTSMPPFVSSLVTGSTTPAAPASDVTATQPAAAGAATPASVAGTPLASFASGAVPQPSVTPSSPATANASTATAATPSS